MFTHLARIKLAATAVQVAAAVAMFTIPAGAAQAEEQAAASEEVAPAAFTRCWFENGHWWCYNTIGAPLYEGSAQGTAIIDHLRTSPSWFVCYIESDWHGDRAHPHRWVYTVGDDHGRSGWVRTLDISSETDTLSHC